MTRFLLFAALLAGLVPAAAAQSAPAPPPVSTSLPRYQFCELLYDGGRTRMNYGDDESTKDYRVSDAGLLSQAVFVGKLHSPSVALNYLSAQGWEVVGVAATATKYPAGGGYLDWERVYTLRRPLP